MASYNWESIKNTFTKIFSKDISEEIPKPTTTSGAGIGRADGVGSSEYLEGGSTYNHSLELHPLNDFLEVGEHTDRRARYLEYDRMENIPEISSALDTYANEVTTPDMEGKPFRIETLNDDVKKELKWLFFKLLNIDTEGLWSWARNLCKNGDVFLELIIDTQSPELGIQKLSELPPETMYRVETVKGLLLEFQQSYKGPDYQAVIEDINKQYKQEQEIFSQAGFLNTNPNLSTGGGMVQAYTKNINATIRFTPEQICHLRIGSKRRGFYPYGVSVLYAGRRVAHLLKLMEDAMVIYRLTRAPERKIFYIDVAGVSPQKGQEIIKRFKDTIKKKKMYNTRTDSIDERYSPWSQDEDFFLAVRPDSNTKIETLPGGSNLGEIDDTKYFRDKLFVSLNLPKTFLSQEDVNLTRTSLTTQDLRFARVIWRIQKMIENGLKNIATRHLQLRGFPEEEYKDMEIIFTQPSDWMEISRSELLNSRYNLASNIKNSVLYDDFTILTQILKHTEEEAHDILSRLEKQILRQQEIQAQAQIYAQLAQQELEEPEPQTQPPIGELPPEGGAPEEISQIPPEEKSPEFSPEEEEIASTEEPKEKEIAPEEETIEDFSDLEADEEEGT